MTPQEFSAAWVAGDDRLIRYPRLALDGLRLAPGDLEFLSEAGLPDSAAPFLGFDTPRGTPPQLSEKWELSSDFDHYRSIGSNGCGDPICIDERNGGMVVELNHDNDFSVTYINSSIAQMAQTLLAFRTLVQETIARNGADAYLDNDVPEELIDDFESTLKRIDPAAAGADTFWSLELERLREGPDEG